MEIKTKVGRPKKPNKKRPVNLTVDEEALTKGKRAAEHLNKSLSQFTEDMWVDLHDNFFGIDKSPEAMLKHFKKQMGDMAEIYKNKLEGDKK